MYAQRCCRLQRVSIWQLGAEQYFYVYPDFVARIFAAVKEFNYQPNVSHRTAVKHTIPSVSSFPAFIGAVRRSYPEYQSIRKLGYATLICHTEDAPGHRSRERCFKPRLRNAVDSIIAAGWSIAAHAAKTLAMARRNGR